MAFKSKRNRKKEMRVSVSFVRKAMDKCGCTSGEFFNRAALAGSAPHDFDTETEAKEFDLGHIVVVPKFIAVFAMLVNDHRCPRNCPRNCRNVSIAPAVSLGQASYA